MVRQMSWAVEKNTTIRARLVQPGSARPRKKLTTAKVASAKATATPSALISPASRRGAVEKLVRPSSARRTILPRV